MTSLAIVFNPAEQQNNQTRLSEQLKETCTYWLFLDNGENPQAIDQIRQVMSGIPGDVIDFAGIPAQEKSEQLKNHLSGKASHLLLLQPGVVVESDPYLYFLPHLNDKSEQVLHLSPVRDVAVWKTIVVPNSPDYWVLDHSDHLLARQTEQSSRNSSLRIIDHNRFPRRRSPDADDIKSLLESYRASPGAQTSMAIAEAFYQRKDYQQARDWFPVALEHPAKPPIHWLANYRSAQCLLQLEASWPDIERHFAAAFELDPDRMEPLYYLVRHYHAQEDWNRACDLAEVASQIAEPAEGVEFEPDIYRYRLAEYYAECCWKLERDDTCIAITNQALRSAHVPEQQRRELASIRARAYARLCPVYPVSIRRRNQLLIVIAFRNAGEFLTKCIHSIQQQDYHDYRVVLVDDASTDDALATLGKLDERFNIIVNKRRKGALHNQLSAIQQFADEDDIIVHVDGDDWLAHDGVLTRINDFFNRTRCWLMYGQFETSLGHYGQCEPLLPAGEPLLEQLTKMHFPMHIRAYRAGVFAEFIKQDPTLDLLKDDKGNYLDAISDLALMRALIQITGIEHTRYNEEILYIYNRSNPESHYESSESRALQQHQGTFVGGKTKLREAEIYQAKEGSDNVGSKSGTTRTLFLALDGVTPALLEQWAGEGYLPNLAKIMEGCRQLEICSPDGFGNDVFWTAVCSGCLPDETGYFFRLKWDPENYGITYVEPARQIEQDMFWTGLADTDAEIAVIDMPEVIFGGQINGLEIAGWLPHAAHSELQTCPAELKADLLTRFGPDELNGDTERITPRSYEEVTRDVELLLNAVRQQTRAAKHYLKRGGWDFFALGYQQLHSMGHQFWYLHDPEHRHYPGHWVEELGDPLLKAYQEVDSGIGELLDVAGEDTNLVIVAGLSMEEKVSCNSVLDQMLWEIDIHDRRQAGQPFPRQGERKQRRFFAIPHNHLSGAVRINLAGRESSGVVQQGQEYEALLELLQERLSTTVNTASGEPVVSHFIPIHKMYSGSHVDELPDLFVVWKREQPIFEVVSPYFEPLKNRTHDVLDARSGDHTGEATLYSNVESLAGENGVINVEDIAWHLVELIVEADST